MFKCCSSWCSSYGKAGSMSNHVIVNILPILCDCAPPPPNNLPPLKRQNAFTPKQWEMLMKPPVPSEAFLLEEWDIEKGRF
jgi:hypothetical protein